ncbi:MAG TPA: hypothetical protein VMI75_02840 [Polyangiaceae bacterium]|nr:hypothetical protein [Polyangiaceae bacterium]
MTLTRDQQWWLDKIISAGRGGIVEDKGIAALRSLVRKGLVVDEDLEVVPATKLYTEHSMTHTLRGRLRFVTLTRYTLK